MGGKAASGVIGRSSAESAPAHGRLEGGVGKLVWRRRRLCAPAVSRLPTTELDRSWTEHADSCWGWAMPSSALLQLTVAKRRDAEVDSSGSFSFPMLLLSMIAELGPSTIGTGTNNIGTNVDAWDRFPFLIMSLALLRTSGRLCLVAH